MRQPRYYLSILRGEGLFPEKTKLYFLIWGNYFLIIILSWKEEGKNLRKPQTLQQHLCTSRQKPERLHTETFLQGLLMMAGFFN